MVIIFHVIHMSKLTAQIKNSQEFAMLSECTHSEYLISAFEGCISKSD